MKLTIDQEFKALIPPLSTEEYDQLEANLKAEGCRDPLVTWDGTIIDGHNRFEICTRNGIGFEKIIKQFSDRSEVIEWIIRNQFGRRKLSDYSRSVLALRLKDTLAARAKENQVERKGAQSGNFDKVVKVEPINTRAEIAKAAGVSEGQIAKVEAIEKDGSEEIKDQLSKGKISINKAHKQVAAKSPKKPRKPAIPSKEDIQKDHQRILGNLKGAWAAAPSAIREEFLAWVNKTRISTNA